MKALLLSIRPEHAINILNGEKTLELRKSVPKGFKGWVYVYVTKGKPRLSVVHDDENGKTYYYLNSNWGRELNGTVPFRFWFDEYEKYTDVSGCGMTSCGMECENDFTYKLYDLDDELEKLCLTYNEVYLYGNRKDLYAWHIKKLDIFDKPMELGEFHKKVEFLWGDTGYCNKGGEPIEYHPIEKAPQSYMYVYVKEE